MLLRNFWWADSELLRNPALRLYLTVDRKIIPPKKEADAFYITISVIKQVEYLVSWNYKHLANINKEKHLNILNWENNYKHDLRIITPLELID